MGKQITRLSPPTDFSRFDEIIDVRSPSEYSEDHIGGAINLPVLDDRERAEIGTIYKQVSPFQARKQGAALVSRNVARHLEDHFAGKPRDYSALLYCWRGGQRSGSMATVLSEVGWNISLVKGGYKAYRRVVLAAFEEWAPDLPLVVLNGYTGAGKTLVLEELARRGARVIDLEGLARHKGSVFGGDPENPQPPQKRFESLLYDALREMRETGSDDSDRPEPVFVEAESAKIGRLNLPNPLWQRMKVSPVIELDSPLAARADYLTRDYAEWVGDRGRVEETLERLRKFHSAETLGRWKDLAARREWRTLVAELLEQHYDVKYTVDGSGHFRKPSRSVPLGSHEPDAVAACAARLREIAPELLASETEVETSPPLSTPPA